MYITMLMICSKKVAVDVYFLLYPLLWKLAVGPVRDQTIPYYTFFLLLLYFKRLKYTCTSSISQPLRSIVVQYQFTEFGAERCFPLSTRWYDALLSVFQSGIGLLLLTLWGWSGHRHHYQFFFSPIQMLFHVTSAISGRIFLMTCFILFLLEELLALSSAGWLTYQ